jgi:hypothetical protein
MLIPRKKFIAEKMFRLTVVVKNATHFVCNTFSSINLSGFRNNYTKCC